MKRTLIALVTLLLALGLLAGCGGATSSSEPSSVASEPVESTPAEDEPVESEPEPAPLPTVYRGVITSLLEDGSIEVEQLYGYNYGYETVVFHIDDNTEVSDGGFTLAEGAFVEVFYSGMLTRSEPPQGNADEVNILAGFGEGIITNRAIREVSETEDGYTLTLLPFDTMPVAVDEPAIELPEDDNDGEIVPEFTLPDSDVVIVHVALDALEGITPEELVAGAQVSVVTYGIMAMSMPPQVSAYVLLPFAP